MILKFPELQVDVDLIQSAINGANVSLARMDKQDSVNVVVGKSIFKKRGL
jgi:hypothetical protein